MLRSCLKFVPARQLAQTRSFAKDIRLAVICGDGIGQEVVPAAVQVLRSVLRRVDIPYNFKFVDAEAGWECFQRTTSALPAETIETLDTCDGAIFGAVSSPIQRVAGYSSPIVALRKHFNLYANLRPCVSAPLRNVQPGIDMLIVRENTECLYVKDEVLEDGGNRAVAKRIISRHASERIATMAFEQARSRAAVRGLNNRKQSLVTVVHKSNVLSVSDGLFRESVLSVAPRYPDVAVEEQLVDSMIYKMILQPQRYDVIVAPNLYGDILSDAAAALVGGLGLLPSANVGDSFVLVEPVHGSAPDIAGKGIANPMASIQAVALLLENLALKLKDPVFLVPSSLIRHAVHRVLKNGPHTPDIQGFSTTEQVTDSVIRAL